MSRNTKFVFTPAVREKMYARIALVAPTGGGKTYSALAIARGLGSNIAVIDTEHDRSKLYAGKVADFAHLSLVDHDPRNYVAALNAAEQAGFDVIIIDSLSHAWVGNNGALEQVDKVKARSGNHNSFVAWRDVTPMQNALVAALLSTKAHVIVTMRAKMEYVMEEDSRGRKAPRKVGLAPEQRNGIEYEFDFMGDIDLEHRLVVSKCRYSIDGLDNSVIKNPGADLGVKIREWLEGGAEPEPRQVEAPKPAAPTKQTRTEAQQRFLAKLGDAVKSTGSTAQEICKAAAAKLGKDLADATDAEFDSLDIAALLAPKPEPARPSSKVTKTERTAANAALHATINKIAVLIGGDDKALCAAVSNKTKEVAHALVRDMSDLTPSADWQTVDVDAMRGVTLRLQEEGNAMRKLDEGARPDAWREVLDHWSIVVAEVA